MRKEFSLENYNPKTLDKKVKDTALAVAANFATVMLIMAMMIIIATTWLDIDITQLINFRFAADAVLTMTLYIMIQIAMQNKGMENGKLDDEYIAEREKYLFVREEIISGGSIRLDEFCEYSTESSLRRKRTSFLMKHVRGLSYSEWLDKFSFMTVKELRRYSNRYRRRKDVGFVPSRKHIPFIVAINAMKPQLLTADMIVLEEGEEWSNDAIAPSPRKVVARRTRFALVGSMVTGTLTISYYAFTIASNPSWIGLVFMMVKLMFLLQRAFAGYTLGSLAYSVSGVAYHVSQRKKAEEYKAWLRQQVEEQEREERQDWREWQEWRRAKRAKTEAKEAEKEAG